MPRVYNETGGTSSLPALLIMLSPPLPSFNPVYWVSLEENEVETGNYYTEVCQVTVKVSLTQAGFKTLLDPMASGSPWAQQILSFHSSIQALFDLHEPRIPEALTTGKQRLLCCYKKKNTTASKCSAAMNCILSDR